MSLLNDAVQRHNWKDSEAYNFQAMSTIGPETIADTLQEEDLLGAYGGFGDKVFLIKVGEERYAANNVSLADGQVIDGLSCFKSADDAYSYMGLDLAKGISGEVTQRTFEEARQIAISKPRLVALLLFDGDHVVDIHFVR